MLKKMESLSYEFHELLVFLQGGEWPDEVNTREVELTLEQEKIFEGFFGKADVDFDQFGSTIFVKTSMDSAIIRTIGIDLGEGETGEEICVSVFPCKTKGKLLFRYEREEAEEIEGVQDAFVTNEDIWTILRSL
jgi:hypothetical protein